jgi:hypothetical protein
LIFPEAIDYGKSWRAVLGTVFDSPNVLPISIPLVAFTPSVNLSTPLNQKLGVREESVAVAGFEPIIPTDDHAGSCGQLKHPLDTSTASVVMMANLSVCRIPG